MIHKHEATTLTLRPFCSSTHAMKTNTNKRNTQSIAVAKSQQLLYQKFINS